MTPPPQPNRDQPAERGKHRPAAAAGASQEPVGAAPHISETFPLGDGARGPGTGELRVHRLEMRRR